MTMPASAAAPVAAHQNPGVATLARHAAMIWPPATIVAALGAWMCFDASPGINWTLWTFAAALGLAWVVRRTHGRIEWPLRVALAAACALAACMAMTADFAFAPIVLLGVAVLLAVSMALAEGVPADTIGALSFIVIPVTGCFRSLREATLRLGEMVSLPRSANERTQARVRGALLAIPVVGVLALLLAGADPVLARLRDDLFSLGRDELLLPRAAFFLGLGALTVGAYGLALRHAATQPAPRTTTRLTLGVTERFMVLASVSGLFALFLGLQVSYFFGNLPALAGSGVTYAEYARNGFGELTFAATAATLLLVWLDQHAERGKGEARAGAAGLVLVFLVQLLLDSAYHRVSLYEAAYGYTAARLYARVYMMVVSVALIALGIELWAQVDAARLVRRVSLLGVAAVVGLSCWNYEAWIVRKNVDRFIAPHYGELDTSYLVYDLSPNAVPEIVRQLPRIPGAYRDQLRAGLRTRYADPHALGTRWYEWSWRAGQARRALASIGMLPGSPDSNLPSGK
jgi:hypothetical protein